MDTLLVISPNQDICGSWHKKDVEAEIQEVLGRNPVDAHEWMSWVFGHDFDDDMFENPGILDVIAENDSITNITLRAVDGTTVMIYKF